MRILNIIIIILWFFQGRVSMALDMKDSEWMKNGQGYSDVKMMYFKDPRPLTEFKIGEKYCHHGSKDWDDRCQDAAVKYAFGENWREFKKLMVKLAEAINEFDAQSLLDLLGSPLFVAIEHVTDEEFNYKRNEVTSDKELTLCLDAIYEVKKYNPKITYKDIIIETQDHRYYLTFAQKHRDTKIRFNFHHAPDSAPYCNAVAGYVRQVAPDMFQYMTEPLLTYIPKLAPQIAMSLSEVE